jgi:uncharacterized protein YqfB (UPF0267 family)
VLLLSACVPNRNETKIPSDISTFGDTDSNTAIEEKNEANSIEMLLTEIPVHINMELGDNFNVDAVVHTPDIASADIIFAELLIFDEQSLLETFYPSMNPERTTTGYDNTILFNDSTSHLNISDGSVAYSNRAFEYVKFPTESFVSSSDVFSSNRCFDEVYKSGELEFISSDSAFETVSIVLSDLSINVCKDKEVYAIDASTMQTEQDEEIERQYAIQREMNVSPLQNPTNGYLVKDIYTKEDEFYVLYFTSEINGIPVTQKSYTIQASDRALNGSTIRVALSQKGIIELRCNGIYHQTGTAESVKNIIGVEDAIAAAYDKHRSIISTDKVTVETIDFEYVPVPYNTNLNQVKLVPSWVITLSYEQDEGAYGSKPNSRLKSIKQVLFINAVTGEEIK